MRKTIAILLASLVMLSGLVIVNTPAVKADTWVEGHITEDTTWRLANSPYLVSDDVYVDEDVTLTIDADVLVKFGGDFSIIVNGNLSAVGTDADKITLTSNKVSPAAGDWETIKFQGAEDKTFTMKYCIVEYGNYGVTISSKGSSLIENSEFYNNTVGIHIIGKSNSQIKSNTIKFNEIGISSEGEVSDIIIADNIISNLYAQGIYLHTHHTYVSSTSRSTVYSYSYIYNVTITGNTVSSNGGSGIYLYSYAYAYSSDYSSYSYSYMYNVTITGNAVSSNGGSGIYLYSHAYAHAPHSYPDYENAYSYSYMYDVTITGNTVSSNGGSGIYLYSYADANAYHSDTGDSYIYNVTITGNTVSLNGDSGIYLYAYSPNKYPYSYIYNVTITGNTVSLNGDSGIYLCAYFPEAYPYESYYSHIYNITITGNTVSSNNGSGIYLYAYGEYYSDIYHTTITSNTVSSNNGSGIYLYAHGYYCGYLYNVTITGNTVSSNNDAGIKTYSEHHYPDVEFDITTHNNHAYSNNQGMLISGGAKANITNNSIGYNTLQGILYDTTTGNKAAFNDIYSNGYGMHVTNSATVKAEQNYWGDASGPYHESMNPTGQGNSVNGDGTDLDFGPFLTSPVSAINERPVAHIDADKTTVGLNEDVTFDASASTDDQSIIGYYFDYGDDTNSSWTTTSVVVHSYSSEGAYNVSLKVRDEYSVESSNVAYVIITVKPNEPPTLSDATMSPSSGTPDETIFYYNVTYADPEGDIPIVKSVYISGNVHELSYVSGSNTTGALYSYQTTLSEGSYTYYFSFNDGISTTRLPTSGSYSGPTVNTVVNQKPTVTINQPTSGITVKGTVTVSGSASDTDGTVQSVEVSIDDNTFATNKLTVSGTTSWSASWDTTQYTDGSHTIYARSYDGIGYSTVKSVTVTINQEYVNQIPIVTISSPSNGGTVSGTVTVSGSASDPDGIVTVVQIRIDNGTWKTASGTASWSYPWDTTNVSDGGHTISVRSSDGVDYSSIDSVNVNVKNEEEGGEEENPSEIPYLYILIPVIIIIVLAGVGIGIKRRKKKVLPPEKHAG
ncbi:MAG: right-handed parallel beta-helix repeat-containing protein [Candidatus Thermoplasmatota archaeon]|nr:right-handed parallel beta-helix repeat-containing protein [Candidatus Thermoplasmatota archaeon]MCG2827587.1 right-handed parallel beta-helix repeat-containing protein [Thermoplasmatales archaeon]